jgi:membrane fusion protein (multidrug efflux system)
MEQQNEKSPDTTTKPAAEGASAANTLAAPAARQRGAMRRPALILSTLILLALATGAGLYWMLVGRYYEDTDDAYVSGRVVTITPQTTGTVVSIGADETDTVKPGQMLVKLDPIDARNDLLDREAQLAQAVRETRTLYANNEVLQANISLKEAELDRAEDDLRRRLAVRETGVVSEEEIRHAELAVATAKASLASARDQLASNRSFTAGTHVTTHPNVLAAAARVREAYLALQRADIVAPVGGQIARRNVQVGQRVSPGNPIMSLVPMDNLWVDANFKEVQLENMRIGQPVKIVADVYGSHVEYHGRVIGLGAGTGSAFALLPAQNATGNWIKVVQRIPVRIALDPNELRAHPLRVGLSIRATVDEHDHDGALVSSHNDASPDNTTAIYDGGEHEADALVQRIIAGNNAPASASTGGTAETGLSPTAQR